MKTKYRFAFITLLLIFFSQSFTVCSAYGLTSSQLRSMGYFGSANVSSKYAPDSSNSDSAQMQMQYVPALMYHFVSPDSSRWSDWCISPQKFEQDIKLIKELQFETMFASEYEKLKSGEIKLNRPIIITFDDGYLSNLEYVLPVLEKYAVKATFYIVGYFVENSSYDGNSYLNEEQLKKLSESPYVEIGNHSYFLHLKTADELKNLSRDKNQKDYVTNDYLKNEIKIEKITGKQIKTLSYPYGIVPFYNDTIIDKLGYSNVFNTQARLNATFLNTKIVCRFNRPNSYTTKEFFKFIINNLKENISTQYWQTNYSAADIYYNGTN